MRSSSVITWDVQGLEQVCSGMTPEKVNLAVRFSVPEKENRNKRCMKLLGHTTIMLRWACVGLYSVVVAAFVVRLCSPIQW